MCILSPPSAQSWVTPPRRSVLAGQRKNVLLGLSLATADAEADERWQHILQPLNLKTTRSWRGIVPFTRLAREGRMTVTVGRRELLAALGGAAAAWPPAARHGLSDPSTEESR